MINIDQLYHLTHCWNPYICFSSHFDSICHWWKMIASRWQIKTTHSWTVVHIAVMPSLWIQGMQNGQYRPGKGGRVVSWDLCCSYNIEFGPVFMNNTDTKGDFVQYWRAQKLLQLWKKVEQLLIDHLDTYFKDRGRIDISSDLLLQYWIGPNFMTKHWHQVIFLPHWKW
jgi:hypothetical protein